MSAAISVILNPVAGGGRAAKAAAIVERRLTAAGIDYELKRTSDIEDAVRLGREAGQRGVKSIAIGGDGLVSAVASGCSQAGGTMAIVPGGRGNDLARVLDIPVETEAALRIALDGEEGTMDLGEANGRPFCCIASLGFDSDANRIANETRVPGGLAYLWAALRALVAFRPARFEVVVDGSAFSFSGWSVIVANSAAYGGGMFIAPDADVHDGLLDVVTTEGRSKLRFLALLPTVFSGRHTRFPEVTVRRGATVEVAADRGFTVYADGDPICELPATITVCPSAVRLMLPRARPEPV